MKKLVYDTTTGHWYKKSKLPKGKMPKFTHFLRTMPSYKNNV